MRRTNCSWSSSARASAKNSRSTPSSRNRRLLLRAFGGHLLVSGCLTLAGTGALRHARPAAALCLLINAFDVTAAILERRTRGHRDPMTTGGIALSGSGAVVFAAALRSLSKA
jgi:hypothetical protein